MNMNITITDIVKCVYDPSYFMYNYCTIIAKQEVNKYKENTITNEVIKEIPNNRLIAGFYPRQSGKTWFIAAYALWYSLFNNNTLTIIIPTNNYNIVDINEKILTIYDNLPNMFKTELLVRNQKKLVFNNNSEIRYAINEVGIHSYSPDLLLLDEIVTNKHLNEIFECAIPIIMASNKSTIISLTTDNLYLNLSSKIGNNWKILKGSILDSYSKETIIKERLIKTIGIEKYKELYNGVYDDI